MGKHGRAPTRSGPTAEAPLFSAGVVVGCGLMAVGHRLHESIGGKPRPVPAQGRDRPQRILLLGVPCRRSQRLHGGSASAAEGPPGNSVGAIGWPWGPSPSPRRREGPPGSGRSSRPRPPPEVLCPSGRAAASRAAASLKAGRPPRGGPHDSYLVDSASSHMLVSKIKPCMSKYKQLYCETANGSLNQLSFI